MMDDEDPPGDWFEIETPYPFQRRAWRNGATGAVLVIETKKEPWHGNDEGPDINVVLLDQEFQQNPEPVETILDQEKDATVALREAWDFMGNTPRQS